MTNYQNYPVRQRRIVNDTEYERINLKDLEEIICEEGDHNLVIDISNREIVCEKCGKGKRVDLSKIIEKDGKLSLLDGTPLTIA